MKRILTLCLFILSVSMSFKAVAQCGAGGITFSSQSDINNFTTNYPLCTQILGPVTIEGANIANLNGLSVLTYISGSLTIKNNPALTDISGLSGAGAGYVLTIYNNDMLTNLTGLSNIGPGLQALEIENNDALTSISALSGISSVGNIVISGNPLLSTLAGLSGISGSVGYLGIINNANLTTIAALSGITSVGSTFTIDNNDALTNLTGLSGMTSVGGFGLHIQNNAALTNVSALSALTTVSNHIIISGNPALTSLSGFSALTSVGGEFNIENNDALPNLTGLAGITTLPSAFRIISNDVLTNVAAMSNLTTVGSHFVIWNNPVLTSLSGFSALTSVGGEFHIENNDALPNLTGLSGITTLPSAFRIISNDVLTNVAAMSNLTTVGSHFVIWSNPALTSLTGFSAITSIGGEMYIRENQVLTSLSGLSGLTSLGGGMNILLNPALASITGLSGITGALDFITIRGNDALISLAGLAGITAIDGGIDISYNATLASITGLSGITGSLDYLYIVANIVPSLSGLSGITSITGDLAIRGTNVTNLNELSGVTGALGGSLDLAVNDNLTNLTGLAGLTSVNGNLTINGGAVLTDISGLSGITSIAGGLYIRAIPITSLSGIKNINPATITGLSLEINGLLSICEVPNICTYLSNPSNPASIFGNATNCANRAAVVAACTPVNTTCQFISPVANSAWVAGATMPIQWNPGAFSTNINLVLYDASIGLYGQSILYIASNIPNTGTFNFVIPNGLPSKCSYGVYIENVIRTNWCYGSSTLCISPTPPTITSTTPASICGPGAITLSATASSGVLNWYNVPTGGTSLGTGSSFITPIISTTTPYYVDATDAGNTSARTQVFAKVLPAPTIGTPSVTNADCNGNANGQAIVLATGGTGAISYSILPNVGTQSPLGTFKGLTAQAYTFTATDANGCSATTSATVTQPNALLATLSVTTAQCNGGSDGKIIVSATGGTPPYSFFSSGAVLNTTGIFPVLNSGSYSFTITDDNGCTAIKSAIVVQPSAISLSNPSVSDVQCNGGATGKVIVSAAGGTGTITFSISPNIGSQSPAGTFTGLTAQTYTVTATDANSCTVIKPATVNQPIPIVFSTPSVTNTNCSGGATGKVIVSATGGTGAITYSILPNIGTQSPSGTFNGLSAQTYTFTATDANGCMQTVSATVGQPTPVVFSTPSVTKPSCNNGSDGKIIVSATGGTGAITYSIAPNIGTQSPLGTFTGLTVQTYTFTATDANGCTSTTSATVGQTPPIVFTNPSVTNVKCFGGATGKVVLSTVGGSGAMTYSIAPNVGTQSPSGTFNGLTAQTYLFTATDVNGCSKTNSITVTQPDEMFFNRPVVSNVSCFGIPNGQIIASVIGGTGPFTYTISPNVGTQSPSGTFKGLSSQSYLITCTDANGCSKTVSAFVNQPTASLVFNCPSVTNVTTNGGNNGQAVVSATGGTPPYTYSINPSVGTQSPAGTFNNLTAQTYTFTVTDANGCATTVTATLTQPPSLTTTNASICPGSPINLSSLITTNGGIVTWSEKPQATAISAGGIHSLALLSNGKVVGWGDNSLGQTTIPNFTATPIAIAAGYQHSLVLLSNGSIRSWGDNMWGQMANPTFAATPIAIAAGGYHSLALLSNSTIESWGYGPIANGPISVPPFSAIPKVITAGAYHSLALLCDGSILGWGWNNSVGQTTIPSFAATPMAIDAGGAHSLALLSNGSVVGWGDNTYGQTGIPSFAATPIAISAGNIHSLALLSNGSVVGWGHNTYGQTAIPPFAATPIAIDAGNFHNLALLNNGSVMGWGDNSVGQAAGYDAKPLTNTTVSPTATTTYYVVVKDNAGNRTTGSVTVSMSPVPTGGTLSPALTKGCATATANLTLSGNSGSVAQWEKQTNCNGAWASIGSANLNAISVTTNASACYRAKVSNGTCFSYSTTATITIDKPAVGGKVTLQSNQNATSVALCNGENALLIPINYVGKIDKWQYSTSTSSTWNDIPSTANALTLSVTAAPSISLFYRVAITTNLGICTGPSSIAYSTSFKVTMKPGCKSPDGVLIDTDIPTENSFKIMKAYPNPTSGYISVDLMGYTEGGAQIEILDLTGRVVQRTQQKLIDGYNTLELDMSNLSSGLYLVRIKDSDNHEAVVRVSKM